MPTSFRVPFTVIERNMGRWIDGRYYNADAPPLFKQVPLTIQMASSGDLAAIEALPYGRRAGRYIRIYSDVKLNAVEQQPGGSPGDLIVYYGATFLIIGESIFTMLQRTRPATPVSHFRYYGAETIEASVPENVP